ncbi:hypothetical protein KVR01_010714 [Diaporthe batatas]|uniref:uncharacterized protein n=1 Tax=Diaporthe batatas TaxID=748121 RepID=UPI001D03F742|nr:uncharacterized protein KVR01_010714 [Diaporthe batatas]KAG8160077.1 hypothetical protein KVR01_010714 [Diaporthe batatas]
MDRAVNVRRALYKTVKSCPADISFEDFINSLPHDLQKIFDEVIHRISQEELPAVRSEIKRTAQRIYDNWGSLEAIVQRHEATIQKRWTNKSITKRRDLLLEIWPNMARHQRPDIILANKSDDLAAKSLLQARPKQQAKQYEGPQREALLMPYMNLHNLTKPEPLLLMINSRARQPPHAFSKRDIQLSTTRFELTMWRSLGGYVMDLNARHSVPESYGELRKELPTMNQIFTGADPRLAGGLVNPGDGLWALEIQDRIYKFLLGIVQKMLHDIPSGELIGPEYEIRPAPPLPSANSRENGVVSLASANLEAIYSSPAQMDFHRLQLLVTAKAHEEEDKLWALREDPGRFSESLDDVLAHQPEYVQDLLGKQHPITAPGARRDWWGSDVRSLEDSLSTTTLIFSCAGVEFWCGLARDISTLVELKAQHFDSKDIEPGVPLPKPFALGLYKVQFTLCKFIENRLQLLRKLVYSSPPLRPYIRRASTDTTDIFVCCVADPRPPRHIREYMKILEGLFSTDMNKTRGHIASVQSVLEEYDMFIETVPDAQQAVTSSVAEEISHITLLSECLRQLHLFQPWEASLDEETIQEIRTVFGEDIKEKMCQMVPYIKFKPSTRTRSMAFGLAKRPYPVHKKRTSANVQAMQDAERLLDQMWDALLTEMEQQNALTIHTKNVLFFQGRQLQRTPDWVDSEPAKPINMTPPQAISPEALVQPFGRLDIVDDTKIQVRPVGNSKIKTRKIAARQDSDVTSEQVQKTEPEGQGPCPTIQVDGRAMRVFSALFHNPSSRSPPREVPWNDFLHAMHSAGFWMEKLYGSVWQFAPRDDNNCIQMRTILVHEPHPHSKIPFRQARRHGRRLARAYGWSGQTFVLKH